MTMTSKLRINLATEWSLAGLTDEERGLVGTNAFPVGKQWVPGKVWLEDDRLRFAGGTETVPNLEGMLDAFVRIDSPARVVRFVQRWGVLGICVHNYPSSHSWRYLSTFNSENLDEWALGDPACFPDDYSGEPVSRWFDYVLAARSILNLAASFQSGSKPRAEDWEAALVGFDLGAKIQLPAEAGSFLPYEADLMDVVNEWLALGGVRPILRWDEGDPQLEFRTQTFGALGLQLLQAVTRSHGLTICSSCGQPYLRTGRKAPAGRRNYCPACGTNASLRDAQRALRARKRAANGKEG